MGSCVIMLVSFEQFKILVELQVIAVNGDFPGPTINVTTNDNVIVNVRNKLDEELLLHW